MTSVASKHGSSKSLSIRLLDILSGVRFVAHRLQLRTPGVETSVPQLRGVWGLALRQLDVRTYHTVFAPDARSQRVPLYLLRPAPSDPDVWPAVDFLLFGKAVQAQATLCHAWTLAGRLGLGSERSRFSIERLLALDTFGRSQEVDHWQSKSWSLGEVRWPLATRADDSPCQVRFPCPLRLLQQRGTRKRQVAQPSFGDLVQAILRRLRNLHADPQSVAWGSLTKECLSVVARRARSSWCGEPLDFVRYSGTQGREVCLRGVIGSLRLPRGPGPLWPLLAAAQWIHLGKGTVHGLGQVIIQELAGVSPNHH